MIADGMMILLFDKISRRLYTDAKEIPSSSLISIADLDFSVMDLIIILHILSDKTKRKISFFSSSISLNFKFQNILILLL